jgi:beta-lactamase superfamily II metal-dependent hydrolase
MARKKPATPKAVRWRKPAKTARRKTAAKAKPSRRKNPSAGVTVRMYRQGLGDCFLLGFPNASGGRFHMLIDCGVLVGTEDQDAIMQRVARDIQNSTGGKLDLLVVTHEHWDHVSGFLQASDVFKAMQVDELWLAWTEQPGHPIADELRERRERQKTALRMALAHAGDSADAGLRDTTDSVRELLGFFGDTELGARMGTSDALAEVRGLARSAPQFRKPGEICRLPGVDGVRVFVLGPPEDVKLLRKSDPTRRGKEVYELMFQPRHDDGWFAALSAADTDPDDDALFAFRKFHPFDEQWDIPFDAARTGSQSGDHRFGNFFRDRYFQDEPVSQAQRIDHDWLAMAVDLALKLDSDTNNTSLVLAIELEESGRVLLFPGDAQVGNWLSWHNIVEWTDSDGAQTRSPTVDELLARTVIYKVGHHGSHNATLRELGLEKMTNPNLMALIPVDEKKALSKRPHPWHMPFGSLYARLVEKTSGRVLRADDGTDKAPPGVRKADWDTFVRTVDANELSLELEAPIAKQ